MSSLLAPLLLAVNLSPTPPEGPAPTAEQPASALEESGRDASDRPKVASKFALTAAYYGETVTHPGVAIGGEFYAFERRRYKLLAAAKTGFYLHPRNHGAYFLDAELGHRVTAKYGLYGDFFTGVGYFHTWPWGDIYVRAPDGGVEKKFNAGHPHVKFGGAIGLGWDISKNSDVPLSVFTRLEVFGEFPFNTGVAVHGALMGGVIWRFGQRTEKKK